MNKIMKSLCCISLILYYSFLLNGCTLVDNKIEKYSSGKEQCSLNIDDVRKFIYKENEYTILEDNVPNSELGEMVGYIRQLVAIDETGGILTSQNIETSIFENLLDTSHIAEKENYIIPFLNIYATIDTPLELIVDVNGGYHKAIRSDRITNDDIVFDFTKISERINKSFEINQQNVTQLLYGNIIYQVTTDTVLDKELGDYIDVLAEKVTFNSQSKKPISKKVLNEIDWFGTNSNDPRESWLYVDVYELNNIDITVAVAVKINGQYFKAVRL